MSNATEFTCPSGGRWYACGAGTSEFIGCCTSEPCSKGCVQGNVRPGGFPVADFNKFPDASCEMGSDFYTCTAGPTFWGCCKSNPCANKPASTCKEGDLVPAFLGRPEQFNAYAPSSLPSPPSALSSGKNNGAVIGGAVGGGIGAAIIIGILVVFFCRAKKRPQQLLYHEAGVDASTSTKKEVFEKHHSAHYNEQSPLPTCSSPKPNSFQPIFPSEDQPYHSSQHTYGYEASDPQELPVETTSPTGHRYSELPTDGLSLKPKRVSELTPDSLEVVAELESPQISPRPMQGEFSTNIAKVDKAAGVASS